ncbi:hypothetical protein [Natronococcus pandeyae]|uniref:hypothetical protein n=1 Tax=Natronococcus pandeyae TaxID=2055836 RepID=UPI001F1DFDA3|nr:hypothetical protein [Natronococcus pandeyae]
MTTSDEGGEVSIPVDTMVTDEREFYGTYGMPPNEYEEIFKMIDGGEIDPGTIVTETCSLEEVPDVLDRLGEYDTMRIPVCTDFWIARNHLRHVRSRVSLDEPEADARSLSRVRWVSRSSRNNHPNDCVSSRGHYRSSRRVIRL